LVEVDDLAATQKFEDVLLLSIDNALKVFGETVKKMILHYLETVRSVERGQIAQQPEAFQKALEELLGTGALVVENQVVQNLYRELDLDMPEKMSFVKAVESARRFLEAE